jgi:hypothetical protein
VIREKTEQNNGKGFSRKAAKDAKKSFKHGLLLFLRKKRFFIPGSLCALCVFARDAICFGLSWPGS